MHARKLYLASLFRVFDEQDYLPSQDPVFDFARPSHFHTEVPADTVEEPIAPRCHFKNVLRNGIVVGAVESRYDHFVGVVVRLHSRSSSATWRTWAASTT